MQAVRKAVRQGTGVRVVNKRTLSRYADVLSLMDRAREKKMRRPQISSQRGERLLAGRQ